MKKLPVIQSFKEVYAGVFTHFLELLRVAWLPLVAWLVISAIANRWMLGHLPIYSPEEIKALSAGGENARAIEAVHASEFMKVMPWVYGLMFVQYFFLSIAAVGFHRFVLLGERFHGWAGTGFVFGRNEFLYVWSLIKIALIAFAAGMAIMIVLGVLGAIGGGGALRQALGSSQKGAIFVFVVLLYVAVMVALLPVIPRMMLVLPHVAVGNRSEVRFVWRQTQGNGWRLGGYFLLVMLVAAVGSMVVLGPVYWLLGIGLFPSPEAMQNLTTSPWLLFAQFLIGVPVSLIWTMLSITMLSVAYREIIGLPPQMFPNAEIGETGPA